MTAGAPPKRILRTFGPPLIVYHLLIFLGAYFVVAGVLAGSFGSELVGGALVGAGVVVEVSVLVGSARLIRRSATGEFRRSPRDVATGERRCDRCDWRGNAPGVVCPRCGAFPLSGPSATRSES